MKKITLIAPLLAATALLAGCSSPVTPAPSAEPVQPATTTVRQMASAVAEFRGDLIEGIDAFDDDMCRNLLGSGRKGVDVASCSANVLKTSALAASLKAELDDLKPWPAEVSELAGQTSHDLAGVASIESDLPTLVDLQYGLLKSTLAAWEPYL